MKRRDFSEVIGSINHTTVDTSNLFVALTNDEADLFESDSDCGLLRFACTNSAAFGYDRALHFYNGDFGMQIFLYNIVCTI